ncbi:hypothetical protein BY458DRAFT_498471 [Sporodiniella umbellata]|nr:hypothetical protein BY458DRAFT_498471 [Sporodiniella umbellata]
MLIKDLSDQIAGLILIENAVSEEEEEDFLNEIEQRPWSGLGIGPNPELKRRTQQYGHLFSYRYRKVLEAYGPLPSFVKSFVARIAEYQWMPRPPNHLLVNEYNSGQGIMPHIDAPALFGPRILSLSLLSPCVMRFTRDNECIDIVLPRRSLIILSKEARYQYKHSISKELEELAPNGDIIHREKRVSLTFREIIAWEDPSKSNQ